MEIKNLNVPYEMAKNYSSKEIRVEMDFDTSRWSRRMQNIVVDAIDTGVANCGYDTAWWVENLLKHYGLGTVNNGGSWRNGELPLTMIKPDKIDEAVSYVAAMLRLKPRESYGGYYRHNNTHWLETLDKNGIKTPEENAKLNYNEMGITDIPIPDDFSKANRDKFTRDYLKPQEEQEQIKRAELINLIRSGSLLSISYIIKN
jgi:hypothetical protein